MRVRFGVARFDDGWNVVCETEGTPTVYDPTFATEAEAESRSRELSAAFRARMRARGVAVEDWR